VRRPNLFILGAPRCGTTAMFESLGAHPQIHAAAVKEPRYFIPDKNEFSLERYLGLFAAATEEPWLLEASAGYLSTPQAPARIREFSPGARAIVMVRDPVEQLRSLHALRVFLHRERSTDLATELARPDAEELYWNLVRNGGHLARLLEVFPREDVLVVVHDDFIEDNAGQYRRVLEFLGVEASFTPLFRVVNATSEPRSKTIQRALWREDGVIRTVARATLPKELRGWAFDRAARANRRPRVPAAVEPALAVELWRELEPDVQALGRLLGRDLVSLWRR
jgi:hypothetical protein